ncbi:MAG TPA: DUF4328 domain-containing protein [Dongiaceae bacterium]|nr:DUF4328 domain-containing protein [Dongiaceae bacterium]
MRTYRDAWRLTRALRWLLIGLAVTSAVTAAAKLSHLRVLQAIVDNDVSALASFPRIVRLLIAVMNPAELAQAIVMCATVVLFAIWIHRMQSNTFALGVLDLQYTPAWAVGWNFVPIANLWIPYYVMREIWCANRNPTGWQFDTPSRFLIVWWLLWLASIVYVRIWTDSGGPQEVLLREVFDANVGCVRAAFGAFSAVASLILVTLLHQLQVRAASRSLSQVFE